ncbi:MAG: homocysteine S-methyltransferase family protein [Rhodobacteraceae bacterium]|jgi:homocysteine S-methyltransferase|nr:homocysteine S-methyltransferase family protein [Paracoccaceae bacterium]
MVAITLIVGNMGKKLIAWLNEPLTSFVATRVILDHPHLVRDIHDDYFAAGATIAIFNTYFICHNWFQPFGLNHLCSGLRQRVLAAGHIFL